MLPTVLIALALSFFFLLYFIYDGYLRVLRILCLLFPRAASADIADPPNLPTVAILVTVFNEAKQIAEKVKDILTQDYPSELLEVVVASDGSTDDVAAVLAEHFGGRVRLVHSSSRVGKSSIQNQAVETLNSQIVLFTDADTRFAPGFLRELVRPFADLTVGAVQAHLLFIPAEAKTFSVSQNRYWRFELAVRQLESKLGILAVASGACIAVRCELWRPLDSAYGEDCILPLDVVIQSRKVAYAKKAIAYDRAEDESEKVFRARVRMTLRNWQGTWSRAALLNPFRYPGYSFALWSHKLLRWLSPIWLLGFSICVFLLPMSSSGAVYELAAVGLLGFYVLAAVGWFAERRARRVPVCNTIYSFILANAGFLCGLIKAARGQSITQYR